MQPATVSRRRNGAKDDAMRRRNLYRLPGRSLEKGPHQQQWGEIQPVSHRRFRSSSAGASSVPNSGRGRGSHRSQADPCCSHTPPHARQMSIPWRYLVAARPPPDVC
ncbi:hypothetical protein ACCO45_006994 [Purpureocillium lilacinum]|uniref:Uncharacterized protein n=1 Tax=Purpureocillium lilacinum TaxID=33203 RepID=A0ACC4DSI0_PURLI